MIENDSHERGDRIRNKITSIIRDRIPPVTSKMTDAYEEYGQQKVEDTFVSTNRSSLDRLEPPISSDIMFHQEEFNEGRCEEPEEFEQEFNSGYSMDSLNLPKLETKKLVHAPISKTFKNICELITSKTIFKQKYFSAYLSFLVLFQCEVTPTVQAVPIADAGTPTAPTAPVEVVEAWRCPN